METFRGHDEVYRQEDAVRLCTYLIGTACLLPPVSRRRQGVPDNLGRRGQAGRGPLRRVNDPLLAAQIERKSR